MMIPCAGMRKTCLMVLSHLILNDMMKVKGHIARLALCLQDDDPRIAGLAQVFFHELSRKAFKVGQHCKPCQKAMYGSVQSPNRLVFFHELSRKAFKVGRPHLERLLITSCMLWWRPGRLLRHHQSRDKVCKGALVTLHCMPAASDALVVLQGTNPIYNLLPDIFSSLSAETQLPSAHFQVTQHPCNPALNACLLPKPERSRREVAGYVTATVLHQRSLEARWLLRGGKYSKL